VIVDEAHVLHKSLLKWMGGPSMAKVPFIGLSATPWARGLGKYYDSLIVAATTQQLIADGYLSPFIAFAPSNPDLSGVSTVAGDFKQDELGDAMDLPSITGDIVKTWLERGENRPTFAFCVNRKHAAHVCERFIEAGVAAEYIDGETSREDREDIFGRFRRGETLILVNVGVLTTGVDLDVRCVIDAKPTKSKMLFVQTIGRGLRTAPGKDNCIILDHAGNHLRLGMVVDIGQDQLDDGKERQNGAREDEKSEPLPCLCKSCKALMPREAKVCPACGEERVTTALVRVATGELVELGMGQTGKHEPADWERRVFYAELRGLRKPHFKSGWAAAQFKEKFGHWPPRDWEHAPSLSPSLATRNWVTSRQIAFSKRRAG
jgi:DNA repair protein RadD